LGRFLLLILDLTLLCINVIILIVLTVINNLIKIYMTVEEIKELSEKIKNSQASSEEKLALLKELNAAVEGLRQDIAILKNDKELKRVRQSLVTS